MEEQLIRAPFQILAIPYRKTNGIMQFCVFHRSDADWWQFIAGGSEDAETPLKAAKREIFEESGLYIEDIMRLTSTCCIPTNVFPEKYLKNWPCDT